MKSKKKQVKEPIRIDLDKTYLIPMSIKGRDQRIETIQEVKVIRTPKDDIVVNKEGFNSKHFYDFYFRYLLDTGYIKIKENK